MERCHHEDLWESSTLAGSDDHGLGPDGDSYQGRGDDCLGTVRKDAQVRKVALASDYHLAVPGRVPDLSAAAVVAAAAQVDFDDPFDQSCHEGQPEADERACLPGHDGAASAQQHVAEAGGPDFCLASDGRYCPGAQQGSRSSGQFAVPTDPGDRIFVGCRYDQGDDYHSQ